MLTVERLQELLHYDPETGVFTCLAGRPAVKVGAVAGYIDKSTGYRRIAVDGRKYGAHQLAWLYVTGAWPAEEIDHINGDPADNRIDNLREATHLQNMRNKGAQSNNKSGFKGVSWYARDGKWVAQIKTAMENRYLGRFDCPAAAHFAYIIAADKYFGEFSRAA